MSSTKLQETLRMLVTANHILHFHGAVDGFGHISVRHPEKPDVYIMCGYMPPALVESGDDLIEYYVDGSAPVDPNAKKGYSERFIHGELFKRYPDVQSVVHSHAEAVLPYATSTVPLLPMYHMGGFLGTKVPVWDIVPLYDDDYQQDMLVNNEKLGASLAASFSSSTSSAAPEKNVVLMKRHGYTTFGKDIPTAVYRTIYTLINAGIQTNATLIQTAAKEGGLVETASVQGLSERLTRDCQKMTEATQDKSWRLWVREVESSPLYKNSV
ncbi:MAG: hypothetical protein M1822_007752 [Bathelium mastoideum]|nr:MAG: hypothetical protein M1822_007752 [Bathelium mastoideum]